MSNEHGFITVKSFLLRKTSSQQLSQLSKEIIFDIEMDSTV
jgi:hypothetical protein